MNLDEVKQYLKQVLNESPMYQNPRKDFDKFYDYVMTNPKAKKTYYLCDNKLKVPSDTILHVDKRHQLKVEQWEFFLNNWENFDLYNEGGQARYNGNPMKYKFTINGRTFGYVIEYFDNVEPMLTTVFEDNINRVSDWVKKDK